MTRRGLRIIGGRHRGRVLRAPEDSGIRPTADRVRESLFNILMAGGLGRDAITGAVVLDPFIGAGALALEALSRGAVRVYGFDISRASLALAQANARRLGETLALTHGDARHPPAAPEAADLVFLDPPYGRELVLPSIAALDKAGWLAPETIIVIEGPRHEAPEAPERLSLLTARRYGQTALTFLQVN